MPIRTPIEVTNSPESPFSNLSGTEVLNLLQLEKWKWDHRATFARSRTRPKIIDEAMIQSSHFIPTLSEVQKGFAAFLADKDQHLHGVHFSGYGAITKSALPHLLLICKAVDFAESLRDLNGWLTINCDVESKGFLD
ncbi:hypothetical protein BGX20_007125, partial [Mortierella sp. AD010]